MESTDQIIQERKVDTSETWLWEAYPDAFRKLLIDHSTKKNIIWATDSYEEIGDGYRFADEITPEKIIGEHGQLIRPRALKDRDEQIRRVKDKAEVFTPLKMVLILGYLPRVRLSSLKKRERRGRTM